MLWRLSPREFEAGKGEENRRAMQELIAAGREPGLLAYVADEPAGWCAIAPRDEYPALARSRILRPVDDRPVWSVACLYISKKHRRKGLSVAILEAAVEHVGRRGGEIVEGYPVEPRSGELAPAFAWTGIASAFLRAGFHESARRSPTRPIMRREIVVAAGRRRAKP
jgi:GNAT superfamily N-acetyltransferase